MQPSLPRLAFLTILALLVSVTSGVRAQTATVLPPLPGDNQSRALWINDWGEVAGNSISEPVGGGGGTRTTTAVVWDSEGTPMALPPLDGDVESSINFWGSNVINNHGQVVGESIASDRTRTPVVWDHRGMPKALSLPPGDNNGSALAISAHGRIVGETFNSVSSTLVSIVVWDQQGRPTIIQTPTNIFERGSSINPRTMVAGGLEGAEEDPVSAVVWDRNGVRRELQPLEVGADSFGNSINARGQVVGNSLDFDQRPTAVVWDQKGRPTALLPLPGDEESLAWGINHRGVVVGKSEFRGPSEIRSTAVIWDRDGTPTALPFGAPGIVFCQARGINKREVVVGYCDCPDCGDPGETLAIVWR